MKSMNPIIKTPWGDHIDLSQVITISEASKSDDYEYIFFSFAIIDIEFKHRNKKISYHFFPTEEELDDKNFYGRKYMLRDNEGNHLTVKRAQSMVDEIVGQWMEYKNYVNSAKYE